MLLQIELLDIGLDALQRLGAGFVVLGTGFFQRPQGFRDGGFGLLQIGHKFDSAVVDG